MMPLILLILMVAVEKRENSKRGVKGCVRQGSAQGWIDSCSQPLEHQNMVPFFHQFEENGFSEGLRRYV